MSLAQRYPATVDYRMKPPGWSELARGPHECAPQFASLWDGVSAIWPFYRNDDTDSLDSVLELTHEGNTYALNVDEWAAVPDVGYTVTERGIGYRCGNESDGDYAVVQTDQPTAPARYGNLISNTDGGTLLWYGKWLEFSSSGGGVGLFSFRKDAGGGAVRLRYESATGLSFYGEDSSYNTEFNASLANPYTAPCFSCMVGTWPPGTTGTVRLFLDGRQRATDTMGTLDQTYDEIWMPEPWTPTTGDNTIVNLLSVTWLRELTPAEARTASEFPFGMLWRRR